MFKKRYSFKTICLAQKGKHVWKLYEIIVDNVWKYIVSKTNTYEVITY